MNRKAAILLALLLCCILILTGCNNPLTSLWDFFDKKTDTAESDQPQIQPETQSMSEFSISQPEDTRAAVLYYKDNENFLVPVMRYIPKGDLGVAKTAISAIIYSPDTVQDISAAGLTPTLPMGTKINGAVIRENGLAIIDFSKEFLNFSSAKAEELGIKAVAYTLTEFPNIKSVEIRVDGKKVEEMPKGTEIGSELKRTEINLQAFANPGEKLSKVVVYYHKKGSGTYSYFVPVTKIVSGFENSAEAAISALLEGPTDGSSLVNSFPDGTKLLEVRVNDGIAYVNFSEQILAKQGDKAAENAMIKAVTLTLKEFPEISKVKIFVNGKVVENTDGVGADNYIAVPVFINFYE
ncbi:MAG: GerMN domain-containing protein [Clostridiaceae bacterium]|nr:GerMN domain-containing protein [Clostridiaceae bacterium]